MQFKDFLTESFSKDYGYRVKIAADCTEEHLDKMEACLEKYSLSSMASMKRTPIQENPMEFVRAKGVKFVSEVCSTDIVLKYPANPRILEVWLAVHVGVDVDRVLVYEVNDPRMPQAEMAAQRLADDVDREVDMDDALLAEETYEEDAVDHDDYYGEGFNKKFLDTLQAIKKEKGANYFRAYPTKDQIMGDDLRVLHDDLMNLPNMGKGDHKEVSINDQNLGGPL